MSEPADRTGCEMWERLDRSCCPDEPPIDWSTKWVLSVDFARSLGTITGTTRAVCESALARHSALEGWQIDPDSLIHRSVEGFQAKYYKWLPGEHEIWFAFRTLTV
jgi:hypothetical protein